MASCLDADKIDYLLRDMVKASAHELPGLQELFADADPCRASTAGSCSCCKRQLLPKLCQLIWNSRVGGSNMQAMLCMLHDHLTLAGSCVHLNIACTD